MKSLCLGALFFLYTINAHAQEPTASVQVTAPAADPAPRKPQVELSEPPPAQKLVQLGFGSGVQKFGGNMGKLYDSSAPILDLRLGFLLSPYVQARAGLQSAGFSFEAEPNGQINSDLVSLDVGLEYHLLRSRQWDQRRGLDPYLMTGLSNTYRSQTFNALNRKERDTAFGWFGGLGLSAFTAKNFGFWAEGRVAQVFFKDRFQQDYLESGIPDMTGPLLTASAGVQLFF